MIPGSNLLSMALRVIAPQTIAYYPYVSRTKLANGVLNPVYGSGVNVDGSFQPVPRSRYENMGLDFQKNYVTIFVSKNVIDIERDVTGDRFTYAGKLYQAESRTDWFSQDGWDAILCVEVPQTTPPFPPS